MADWKTLSLVFVILGFELDVFAVASFEIAGKKQTVSGLKIFISINFWPTVQAPAQCTDFAWYMCVPH